LGGVVRKDELLKFKVKKKRREIEIKKKREM
jgi:hypothetical protein